MADIVHRYGHIFNSCCQTLVNPVNCQGCMGKGLALLFACRYSRHTHPRMLEAYRRASRTSDPKGQLRPGRLMLYKTPQGSPDPWVLQFPTKESWSESSRIEYIASGLEKFALAFRQKGIVSVAFPLLGCDNGGLDEGQVIPLMERTLAPCDIPVEIWHYAQDAEDTMFSELRSLMLERPNLINSLLEDLPRLKFGFKQRNYVSCLIASGDARSMSDLLRLSSAGKQTATKCFALLNRLRSLAEADNAAVTNPGIMNP
ncbi:MAG: macro domain-containing protein [Succinivibrionaceae bacterium]|nr:macro domain-containing protein [Succinivibrionaceae bacterium]